MTYDVTGLPWYEDGCYSTLPSATTGDGSVISLEDALNIAEEAIRLGFNPGVQIRGEDGTDIRIGDGGPNDVPFL